MLKWMVFFSLKYNFLNVFFKNKVPLAFYVLFNQKNYCPHLIYLALVHILLSLFFKSIILFVIMFYYQNGESTRLIIK